MEASTPRWRPSDLSHAYCKRSFIGVFISLFFYRVHVSLLSLRALFVFYLQGRTELYGSKSELDERGVDPATLLGLINEEEEKENYECPEEEETVDNGLSSEEQCKLYRYTWYTVF